MAAHFLRKGARTFTENRRKCARTFTKNRRKCARTFTKNRRKCARTFTENRRKCARTFTENRRKGNRLMCPAQPGHGGKRRDSPEGRVSSAITKLMQMIDHEPSNLNETQYSYITFGTLDCLGACLAMAV